MVDVSERWAPPPLEGAEDELQREIHAFWRAGRFAAGWRCGRPSRVAKTSPYLKPLDRFSPEERRRERLLAVGDVHHILAHTARRRSPTSTLGLWDLAAELDACAADPAFWAPLAADIHAHWAHVNQLVGFDGDPRTERRFDALSLADRALSLSNVRADLAAIRAVAIRRARRSAER